MFAHTITHMSLTSHIPLLHAGADTVVLVEDGGLTVRRPHEQAHIPLAAISRARVEADHLAIELTASPGMDKPFVHRVWDVADAGVATAFADAVNAALPERPEGVEPVDGAGLVSGERLYQPSYRRWLRRMRLGTYAGVVLVIGVSVLVGVLGTPTNLALVTPLGLVAIPVLALGAFLLYTPVEERYLRKRGVRTAAVRLHGRSGEYVFTDPSGMIRTVFSSVNTWSIEALYDPRDPGRVLALRSRKQRLPGVLAIFLVLAVGFLFAYVSFAAATGLVTPGDA